MKFEVLNSISRKIYLHFFDRELMTSIGAYQSLSDNQINDDLRFIMFLSYEPCYISAGHLFENRFAQSSFKTFPSLFQTGHIQIALRESSITNFIDTKQEQYKHKKTTYSFYFDDEWKKIEDFNPYRLNNKLDTGSILENDLVKVINEDELINVSKRLFKPINLEFTDKVKPFLVETLRERGKKAVTKGLYDKLYMSFDIDKNLRKSMEIIITERYINTYLNNHLGTLITGLSSGMEHFSFLCKTYPFHDLNVWRQIYSSLGCTKVIRNFTSDDILNIRDDFTFINFVKHIRSFIFFLTKEEQEININMLSLKLRSHLIQFGKSIRTLDEFITHLEQVTLKIASYIDLENVVSDEKDNDKNLNKLINNKPKSIIYYMRAEHQRLQHLLENIDKRQIVLQNFEKKELRAINQDNDLDEKEASDKIKQVKIIIKEAEDEITSILMKLTSEKDKKDFKELAKQLDTSSKEDISETSIYSNLLEWFKKNIFPLGKVFGNKYIIRLISILLSSLGLSAFTSVITEVFESEQG